MPTTLMPQGKTLYIRVYDKYNDGTVSAYRYLASAPPVTNLSISLTNDSGIVVTDKNGNAGAAAYGNNTTTTVKVYDGQTEATGWTFSGLPASSTDFTWDQTNENTFKITYLKADVGELTI